MQLIELIVYPYTINYRVKTAYLCAFIEAVRINCINCMRFWILTSVNIIAVSAHLAFYGVFNCSYKKVASAAKITFPGITQLRHFHRIPHI